MAKLPGKPAKTQSLRERAAVKSSAKPKVRRVRRTASGASKPFILLGRLVVLVARPFRFILWPFKTRPVRFIGRMVGAVLLLKYIRNSWKELRQVEWPKRRETAKLTSAVFIFAIVFSLVIAVTDYGLDKVFRKVLIK